MAEDSTQANTSPVEATQEAPMPSADQKVPDAGQVDPEAASTNSEESSPTEAREGLPENVSERTRKEFERLREQLRLERQQRLYTQGVFNAVPPAQPSAPVPLYDPETGLLNEQAFDDVQQRARAAEERAARAEQAISNLYEDQQKRETFSVHPELDPSSKSFNKDLHVATRRILMDSMVNPDDYGGKQLSFKEAADLAKGLPKTVVEQVKKEAVSEALEQLTPKEQASLEATGSPDRRSEVETPLPNLRERSRKGDLDAIVERLKKVPVVGRG